MEVGHGQPRPGPGVVLTMGLSAALFVVGSAWAWGSWSGLFDHPARVAAFVVMALATVAVTVSGLRTDGFKRSDARRYWWLAPLTLFSLVAVIWLPPYADARDLWTLEGDAARYLGLALLTVGCVLRVGPMFVLGRRFTFPLAEQHEHRLVTTGFYRVIRNPSYLGALIGGMGWALVFRCWVGALSILLLIPLFVFVVRKEEALLLAEFGDEYAEYRRRTWRLVPFVY
jgi:protein-S-isoprenylcysteine O-methyltransferase Ste14